ncbi:MAG: hypothetical protein P1U89_23125 [Verrucomicrobiales bacterium]|nr:hypothetical protein [Verrucomicrobiales bacterium]
MNQTDTARKIRDALPESGLFADRAWRVSPEPFPLDKKTVKALEKLGPILYRFQRSADLIYRRSRKGTLPDWISGYLDQGKPESLTAMGLEGKNAEALPRVIRPDLILTEGGYAASELDSVPGGIGLTAWLGQVYSSQLPDRPIVGGPDGMLEGFRSIFSDKGADILVSSESADYRPEMEWLANQLKGDFSVEVAESYRPDQRDIYRFFELFDLPNIKYSSEMAAASASGRIELTSPMKPWLEEKMWSALFWSLPLRDLWRQELRDSNYQRLRQIFPRSWVIDPVELPHQAAIPGLEIQHFNELKNFSQTERELVLKLSGYNEKAWGSRSVTIGHDASTSEWSEAVDEAISSFGTSPYVLQKFHQGKRIQHPWLNEETGQIEMMDGRVRLCPYYFVGAENNDIKLGGALATICPADKKIIHGMSEAILAPCAIS